MIFARLFFPQFEAYQLSEGESWKRGPDPGLSESEIMTILIMYHGSHFRHLKSFYNGVALPMLKKYFPGMPSYERFTTIQSRALPPMMAFLTSKFGKRTGIYYIDSTSLPVCHNKRINRHKTFQGLAERGKTSMGWFFGFKMHVVFNHLNEIVAVKLTAGNVADSKPVDKLTKGLVGKLFGDKGYIGKKLAETLLRRGLALMTRVRKNMKALPVSFQDKALLNGRNMAETIFGKIKEFSSLNLPRHRSVTNAMLHILAALTAYQINPIKPKQPLALQKI